MKLYQVDAFTQQAFRGNPAVVCRLEAPASAAWMQDLAREMQQSETAFLWPEAAGYRLRWFTPDEEVDLCGHATLASAFVLWQTGEVAPSLEIVFETRSGPLTARRDAEGIELNFPVEAPSPCPVPPDLPGALGVPLLYVGRNRMDYLVEVASEAVVRQLQPRRDLIQTVQARGVIVTARASHPDYDFVSRFFGPHDSVFEDPVTGSAHCCLAPYWAPRLGKSDFSAYQASARGGQLQVSLRDQRVVLRGQAVLIWSGQLASAPL